MSGFEKPKEQEKREINIGDVYFDDGLKDIMNREEFSREIQMINREIEKYLGENENLSAYDFRIYSDRKGYEEYFRTHFPEETFMENDMVFCRDEKGNRNIIAKFMKRTVLDPSDPSVQKYLEKENITGGELESRFKQNYKSNIYPTMAHEMTHAHSFFKGVHYRTPGNKWAQEMVCVFVDQKMWEKYTKDFFDYRKMTQTKAKEQARDKNLYDEIVKDFKEGDFEVEDWERFVYQFLENRYGKEKLRDFWIVLSEYENKPDFERCFESVFEEKLKDVMNLFQKEVESFPSPELPKGL